MCCFIEVLNWFGRSFAIANLMTLPYWHMISLRGMLIDYGHYFDKEAQKELLEREGHVIEQPDPNKRLYRVQNYKAALFDLNKLIIKE